MNMRKDIILCCIAAILSISSSSIANAQGGRRGGAGQPSLGRVGAGAGRPSQIPSASQNRIPQRPNLPQTGTRPSLGNALPGNLSPQIPSLPNSNIFSPSGGRPNVSIPNGKPGNNGPGPSAGTRPKLPEMTRPVPLPSVVTRPGIGDRLPSLGNVDRPTTLPGNLSPGNGGNPPNISNVNRPTTLPGKIERPNIGGGNRPEIVNNTKIGKIKSGISNGNINIGNDVTIGSGNIISGRGGNFATTLPAWDRPGVNKPGWGLGNPGHWNDNWHSHCVHHHHDWYHGCWNHGCWGGAWYRPTAWIIVGWGLRSTADRWGYGVRYYNPYYVAPAGIVVYDYGQPVVINDYQSMDPTAVEASNTQLGTFDQGLAQFKLGNYQQALVLFDQAIQLNPGDAVVHEVRALTLFALKQYLPAATALNSLLSSGPGMDWTTMSSLYENRNDYSAQLATLEKQVQENANEPAALFVLSYHYLVQGEQEKAILTLENVVRIQPKDSTAKRMLDALASLGKNQSKSTQVSKPSDEETDLIGNWKAIAGNTSIELSIAADTSFQWKASTPGQPSIMLSGQLSADQDAIVLVNEEAGSIAGSVTSMGNDQWQFSLEGEKNSDAVINFTRTKS